MQHSPDLTGPSPTREALPNKQGGSIKYTSAPPAKKHHAFGRFKGSPPHRIVARTSPTLSPSIPLMAWTTPVYGEYIVSSSVIASGSSIRSKPEYLVGVLDITKRMSPRLTSWPILQKLLKIRT